MMREGCKNWTQYLAELVGWLNTNKEDTTILNAGLECLCLIFSKSDNTVSLLVPDLMPIMYDIFTLPEVRRKIFLGNWLTATDLEAGILSM